MQGSVTVEGAAASDAPAADDHGGPTAEAGVAADPNAPAPVTYDPRRAQATRRRGARHRPRDQRAGDDCRRGLCPECLDVRRDGAGPVIRVKVGDTIRVHLKNPIENQLPHSIDFHASQVAWNDEMTSIAPGEEKVYEWTADYAGVWMYHCGTSPALHHIANGMYGMVIVEPAEGLLPSTTSSRSSNPSGTSASRASRPTSRRPWPRHPLPTSSCSTASRTSTSTHRSRSEPASGPGLRAERRDRRLTAPTTSSARSSTP